MVRQQLDAEFLAGPGEGFRCLANATNLAARINACSAVNGDAGGVLVAGVEFFQERSGCRDKRNLAVG
jgi:hypothetical protein